MLNTTVQKLRCHCQGSLELTDAKRENLFEVRSGFLKCKKCKQAYPILEGVALLVEDPARYLSEHAKGIAQIVPDSEIPPEYKKAYLEAKEELIHEHQETDLEAERVVALYFMNHYLRADAVLPPNAEVSPLIASLVQTHWDRGPFQTIEKWVDGLGKDGERFDMIDLGCGVGGLYLAVQKHVRSYLGVDGSFASIALARHLVLGVPYRHHTKGSLRVPSDLLLGPVSREVKVSMPKGFDGSVDYIVCDFDLPMVRKEDWDLSFALNFIDMLEDPSSLPKLQHGLLREGGVAIQSCPYIWHEHVAKKLRATLSKGITTSDAAGEALYQKVGFNIEERVGHVPWLFFKHLRQLEIYSVHLFTAKK